MATAGIITFCVLLLACLVEGVNELKRITHHLSVYICYQREHQKCKEYYWKNKSKMDDDTKLKGV